MCVMCAVNSKMVRQQILFLIKPTKTKWRIAIHILFSLHHTEQRERLSAVADAISRKCFMVQRYPSGLKNKNHHKIHNSRHTHIPCLVQWPCGCKRARQSLSSWMDSIFTHSHFQATLSKVEQKNCHVTLCVSWEVDNKF